MIRMVTTRPNVTVWRHSGKHQHFQTRSHPRSPGYSVYSPVGVVVYSSYCLWLRESADVSHGASPGDVVPLDGRIWFLAVVASEEHSASFAEHE